MKTKIFLYSLISLLFVTGCGLSFTSCSDIMDTGSTYTMFDEDNKLNSSSDTVYSVIGILSLVQKVADRNVLFGELRGDLVNENSYTTTDLREIINFNMSDNNAYNNYGDYYAIINNCNYFLAKADTSLTVGTDSLKPIFKKEYAAVKGIRAWTYLQLAQIYGSVPFYTTPLTKVSQALKDYPYYDVAKMSEFFIKDLTPYLDTEMPSYGTIYNGETNYSSRLFFFPLRLVLGDLCLWSGRYSEAANYYYEYLTLNKCVTNSNNAQANINANDKVTGYSTGWIDMFNGNTTGNELITIIPMASEVQQGTKSELENVFSGTTENEYKCPVYPSARYKELSESQSYAYDKSNLTFTMSGDMRRKTVYDSYPGETNDENGSIYSTSTKKEGEFTCKKYQRGVIYVYRVGQIYLRLAEALNRAGYPGYAFAILKYGVNGENLTQYVGLNNLTGAPYTSFFGVTYDQATTGGGNWGIHARGCGPSTHKNSGYAMPMLTKQTAAKFDSTFVLNADSTILITRYYHGGDDTQGYITEISQSGDTTFVDNYSKAYTIEGVEDLISDETALEEVFEGTRYYNLLRIALHRNDDLYLAKHIGYREGSSKKNTTLYSNLSNKNNWYFPFKR